jgi:hypothetical protein
MFCAVNANMMVLLQLHNNQGCNAAMQQVHGFLGKNYKIG